MKTTTEMEIKVSGGQEYDEDIFVLVEASKLSLDDEFMAHEPTTNNEEELKKYLTDAIKSGLHDFYRPVLDPSFDGNGGICYVQGKRPAVGKTYSCWKKKARCFMPERGSRLGTITEYVAFLGVLIKLLASNGCTISKAWEIVCNDSKGLGHYHNSKLAIQRFERTGSRNIVGFYDLANTHKILVEDKENNDFVLAGGCFIMNSYDCPLAFILHNIDPDFCYSRSVGWIILER